MYWPWVTFFLLWNTREDILKNGVNWTVLMTNTETFLKIYIFFCFCFTQKKGSHLVRFETTWGWQNDDRINIFWGTFKSNRWINDTLYSFIQKVIKMQFINDKKYEFLVKETLVELSSGKLSLFLREKKKKLYKHGLCKVSRHSRGIWKQ